MTDGVLTVTAPTDAVAPEPEAVRLLVPAAVAVPTDAVAPLPVTCIGTPAVTLPTAVVAPTPVICRVLATLLMLTTPTPPVAAGAATPVAVRIVTLPTEGEDDAPVTLSDLGILAVAEPTAVVP